MNTLQTTPIKISNHALAAKSIRNELKTLFPGIKFKVTSKSYSMGDSVNVSWLLGPTSEEVDAVINKYQHGSFNGMDDLYTYKTTNFHKEHGSTKYVFSNRSINEGYEYEGSLAERIAKDICVLQKIAFFGANTTGLFGENDRETVRFHVGKIISKTSFKFDEKYAGVRFATQEEQDGFCWAVILKGKA